MKDIDFESINTIEDIKNYGSEKEWIDLLNGIVAPMKVNIRSFQDVLSICIYRPDRAHCTVV